MRAREPQRQGYQCYLPTLPSEKLRQGVLMVMVEPIFSRYLFIRLCLWDSAKSWAPIRSTKVVSRLVSFGVEPAKVDDGLIDLLRTQDASFQDKPIRLFRSGKRVRLTAPSRGHRRRLSNGRWRASGHGTDRVAEQVDCCCAGVTIQFT